MTPRVPARSPTETDIAIVGAGRVEFAIPAINSEEEPDEDWRTYRSHFCADVNAECTDYRAWRESRRVYLRTAEMIGVRSQRELRLAQRLQGVVIASALDVESVNARIDYETAHLQEVQVYLSARRDRRVDFLNLGNLFIGGGVGAVGSGLQLISSAQHARNVVSTSAGFGGTVLSVTGLKQQKGQLRSPEYTPADCVGAG